MFLSLIETGLADVGVGFSDYTRYVVNSGP